jgi:hypothetical protein
VDDAAPGHQGEDLVDGLDRLRAADWAPRRSAPGDEQVVDGWWGGRGEQGNLLVGQILDGYRVLAGQAMRGGDGERPLVVGEDGARGEVCFVDGQPVAQDVDVAPAQRPVGIERHDLLKPDLTGGIAGLEGRREPAERRAFGGEDEADAQQPADGARQFAGVGQGLIQCSERGYEAALEPVARGRQADPAAGPVEDLHVEPGLKGPYRLAHPGLGDAQALSRAPEVQLVGEHEEDPQLA